MNSDVTVMVVEDDPEVLYATSRVVERAGYRVLKAASAGECLKQIKEHHPDLILLDVVLPDMGGADLCAQIKSDPDLNNPFVILTSGMKTSSLDQADGLLIGADGYIARPITNHELAARIHAMVRILYAERERDRLIAELEEALGKIKTLTGLLPICSYCKNIRDDKNYWNRIEEYIQDHSDAEFSHGICPECAEKHFGEFKTNHD